MFNPIHNRDGSVSYFRLMCLLVAFSCFVCGCVMKTTDTVNEQVVANNTVTENEEPEEDTPSYSGLSSEELRTLVLRELSIDSDYMQTCGAIDRVYDSCSVTITDSIKPFYDLKIEASADGYTLRLVATEKNDDSCAIFESTSDGEFIAYNKSGQIDSNCLKGLQLSKEHFVVRRDTDSKEGEIAPSGFTPIVKNLTQR